MQNPNLYDFLRRILGDATGTPPFTVNVTPAEIEWLKNFMTAPDHSLHFKARKVGEQPDGEPIMAMDFAIAGEGFEIFTLLCEAMVQNFQFAEMVMNATSFYRDHIPTCPECSKKHFGAIAPPKTWEFCPHKPQE